MQDRVPVLEYFQYVISVLDNTEQYKKNTKSFKTKIQEGDEETIHNLTHIIATVLSNKQEYKPQAHLNVNCPSPLRRTPVQHQPVRACYDLSLWSLHRQEWRRTLVQRCCRC